MTHPTRETWMSYLYGELKGRTRARAAAHLAACAECRSQVATWRAAQAHLDAWQLPAPRTRVQRWTPGPLLRWAAAAVVMIGLGFTGGRLAAPRSGDLTALRQELATELAKRFEERLAETRAATLVSSEAQAHELLAQVVKAYEENRTEDARSFFAALERLDAQRAMDYVALRKDLETVALYSDVGLRQTRQDLIRLADYSPAAVGAERP